MLGVVDAMSAARRWAGDLARWAIPQDILAKAPQSPWILPVELFRVDGDAPDEGETAAEDTPSRRRALEALPRAGSVLDLGCGGGRATFALVPPAAQVTGVDRAQDMLDAFAAAAQHRGVAYRCILGDWPDVEARTPAADVVLAHHVAYNVPDLAAFALAATRHARRRVVFELPDRHPLTSMAPLWRHFWGLDRPERPTAQDALGVLREAGLAASLEAWQDAGARRPDLPRAQRVTFTRIRLCLPAERDPEVAAVLDDLGPTPPRRVATIWWDVADGPGARAGGGAISGPGA
jgi:SAM-dependent methyltransferase